MAEDPLQRVMDGLKREKAEIAMVDEMSRRAGLAQERGRYILAAARATGRTLVDVAWAIKKEASGS